MWRKSVLFVFLLCINVTVHAIPARPGIIRHVQPDGYVVEYTISGDEFGHISKTLDGCAVAQGSDGSLYYVHFEPDGTRRKTSYRVSASAPGDVVSASRSIPFSALKYQAAQSRRERFRSPDLRKVRTKSSPSVLSTVILLAQFPDLGFKYDRQNFVDMLSGVKYSFEDATGSALDYFSQQFGDRLAFKFDVGPVVTLSHGFSYYGEDDDKGDDMRAHEAVYEACVLSDPEVDFGAYDNIFVFFAGGNPADGGASDDHIWPHNWGLSYAGMNLLLDGRRINEYSVSSELMNVDKGLCFAGIGTFCHEFSHTLGLRDLYDTDYEDSGGKANALWSKTALMDGGNYNNNGRTPPNYNAIDRWWLEHVWRDCGMEDLSGYGTPSVLKEGQYSLPPISRDGTFFRLDTDCAEEFYLLECREKSGWDAYIGGSGMLIYHIDHSDRDALYSTLQERNLTALQRWHYNEINCNPEHQCACLVPSDPGASDVHSVFWPNGARNCLTPSSSPSLMFWSGTFPMFSITTISNPSPEVSFVVSGPIVPLSRDIYQDAAIISWQTFLVQFLNAPSWIEWQGVDGVSHHAEVEPYEEGKFCHTLEGLEPNSSYSVRFGFSENDTIVHSLGISFTTNPLSGQPFIFVHNSRGTSGRFSRGAKIPLRVYNAADVVSVKWTMDAQDIHPGGDGYYEIQSEGELRAEVEYSDGSTEILYKKVKIK